MKLNYTYPITKEVKVEVDLPDCIKVTPASELELRSERIDPSVICGRIDIGLYNGDKKTDLKGLEGLGSKLGFKAEVYVTSEDDSKRNGFMFLHTDVLPNQTKRFDIRIDEDAVKIFANYKVNNQNRTSYVRNMYTDIVKILSNTGILEDNVNAETVETVIKAVVGKGFEVFEKARKKNPAGFVPVPRDESEKDNDFSYGY